MHLQQHPLCVMCREEGKVTPATVVNHRIAHRGDQELFWDQGNWESLCASHHNSDAQVFDKTGKVKAKFDANGRVIWR